jgi:hypothetical protein
LYNTEFNTHPLLAHGNGLKAAIDNLAENVERLNGRVHHETALYNLLKMIFT